AFIEHDILGEERRRVIRRWRVLPDAGFQVVPDHAESRPQRTGLTDFDLPESCREFHTGEADIPGVPRLRPVFQKLNLSAVTLENFPAVSLVDNAFHPTGVGIDRHPEVLIFQCGVRGCESACGSRWLLLAQGENLVPACG